jgi:hypothetical protein
MNVQRIKQTIALLKKIDKAQLKMNIDIFNMSSWCDFDDPARFDADPKYYNGKISEVVEHLHNCGTSACMAGHMGFYKPFRDLGFKSTMGGQVQFAGLYGSEAVAAFFEIDDMTAEAITMNGGANVSPSSQAARLQKLLEFGEKKFMEVLFENPRSLPAS